MVSLVFSIGMLKWLENLDKFQGYISGHISFGLGVEVFMVSSIMAILGALLPAIYASRIDPVTLIQKGN